MFGMGAATRIYVATGATGMRLGVNGLFGLVQNRLELDPLSGHLSLFYVCGSPGCQCKATPPKKQGPYYQVSFTRKGRSSSKFIRKEDLPAIRKQLKNYESMKLLVDRWVELATERSNLRLKRDRA
jgi:hypothetical protein